MESQGRSQYSPTVQGFTPPALRVLQMGDCQNGEKGERGGAAQQEVSPTFPEGGGTSSDSVSGWEVRAEYVMGVCEPLEGSTGIPHCYA